MTQVKSGDKLYIVTRADLSAGYQGVQGIHAAIQFAFENPDVNKEWFEKSNYLGFLSVHNEQELQLLIQKAYERNIKCSVFREPDIDNQITAIALAPGEQTKKLCSRLPLALKEMI